MRSFSFSLPKRKIVLRLVFTVLLLMAGGIFQSNAVAQDAGAPPPVPEPPPPPVAFENRILPSQLTFLNDYANQPSGEVFKDKRFRSVMKMVTPRTEYHYGRDMPLSDASESVLDGTSLPVDVRDGRYVMLGTRGGPYLRGKGFVWFDIQEGIALGGVYFHPVNGEPTPTLAIFSRQLRPDSLSMSQLPVAFAQAVAEWSAGAGVQPITVRYFIPDNGRKYVLIHDEDYCDHPENAPAPPQDECEQMNADAADIDVNAAYFMQETHNQANATAWMLGEDQVAWIGLRTQTCGTVMACRIRVTRQRTRVLIGGVRRR